MQSQGPPADPIFLGGNTAFGTVSRGVFWGVSRGITQDRKGLIGALDMDMSYEGQPGFLQGLSLSLYCKTLLSTTWVLSVGLAVFQNFSLVEITRIVT